MIAAAAVCALATGCGDSDDDKKLPGPPALATTALGDYKFDNPKEAEDADAARRATGRYQSERNARADGYQPAPGRTVKCNKPKGKGNGGVEYVNAALVKDPKVELRRPEVLLYGPEEGGGLKLIAIEYRPGGGQQAKLFNRQLSGPLTVWLWLHNPDGLFAPGNVNSPCRPGPIEDIPLSTSKGGGGGGGGATEGKGGAPQGGPPQSG